MNEQKPVACIRSLTDQCAALIQERDELQKQVWRYEKHGVTCQTYRHKIESSCSECNVHENYTAPPVAASDTSQQQQYAWKNAAMRIGEELSSVGPNGYYNMTAEKWLDWAMDQQPRGKNSLSKPQREWQGLTDEEIVLACAECAASAHQHDDISFAHAIETKLKEKNT